MNLPEEEIRPTVRDLKKDLDRIVKASIKELNKEDLRIKHALERYIFVNNIIESNMIIDVGCGNGLGLTQIKHKRLVGIDICESAISYIKTNFENIETYKADASKLDSILLQKQIGLINKQNTLVVCFELLGTDTFTNDYILIDHLLSLSNKIAISIPNYKGMIPKPYFSRIYDTITFNKLFEKYKNKLFYSQWYPTKRKENDPIFKEGLDPTADFMLVIINEN